LHSDPKGLWIPRLSNAPSIVERKECILIVHEDEGAREHLKKLMHADGYDTFLLESADLVRSAVAQSLPDLILLHLMAPSGLGLCGELRMLEPTRDVPIILTSERSAGEDLIARGLLAGADDYVAAERPTELSARVRVQLRNKRYRDALQRVRGEREALRHQAAVDPLTGLLNRRSLADVISEKVIAGEPLAVLFIDIDHFKSVNDRFGHATGDLVLKEVADCLKRGMRSGDHCGRYGGEEFVLLAPGVVSEQAYRMAERHRAAVAALQISELPQEHRLTVSIGVAVFEAEGGETSDDLLERADTALYMAKTTGRNRVVVARDGSPSTLPGLSASYGTDQLPLARDRAGGEG
jgi:two-component system cell cycle response regulator